MRENRRMCRAHLEAAEVGLELPSKDLQRRRLACAIGSEEAEHRPCSRCREAMQLERVGAISVRHVGSQVARKVDDLDRIIWAVLCPVEAREAAGFMDHALSCLDIAYNALLATFSREPSKKVEGRHVWLAFLWIKDQYACAFSLAYVILTLAVEAFRSHAGLWMCAVGCRGACSSNRGRPLPCSVLSVTFHARNTPLRWRQRHVEEDLYLQS